jgi:UvrD-like helicase C-terminal domain
MLVLAYAATIHGSQGSEYPAVIIPMLTQHYAICSGTFSTPASRAANAWSCWSVRRRLSPSRYATSPADGVGRNCANG